MKNSRLDRVVRYGLLGMIIVLLLFGSIKNMQGRAYYRTMTFSYLLEVDMILDELVEYEYEGEVAGNISDALVLRIDRLVSFIHHSNEYLNFNYQSEELNDLKQMLEEIVIDDYIDSEEMCRIELIHEELEKLLDRISLNNDKDEVNPVISMVRINDMIELFARISNNQDIATER